MAGPGGASDGDVARLFTRLEVIRKKDRGERLRPWLHAPLQGRRYGGDETRRHVTPALAALVRDNPRNEPRKDLSDYAATSAVAFAAVLVAE
jgi:hypothetical protein